MHVLVELVRTVTRKSRTVPAKNVASAITLRTSALAEFVKNVVKKKQSAAVKMLTILAAGSYLPAASIADVPRSQLVSVFRFLQ